VLKAVQIVYRPVECFRERLSGDTRMKRFGSGVNRVSFGGLRRGQVVMKKARISATAMAGLIVGTISANATLFLAIEDDIVATLTQFANTSPTASAVLPKNYGGTEPSTWPRGLAALGILTGGVRSYATAQDRSVSVDESALSKS